MGRRGKPSARSQWASASKATHANPNAAHPSNVGLAQPLQFYVCGLQSRPSGPSFHCQE